MSKLYLMMGIPGSGKSTWAKNNISNREIYISRDEIRLKRLKDGESYWAHEKESFKEFIDKINEGLKQGNVFADATHLNSGSRAKVVNKLKIRPDEINVVFLNTNLETCLERNAKRTGRRLVPEESIKEMYDSLAIPTSNEDIDKVFIINQDKPNQYFYPKEGPT